MKVDLILKMKLHKINDSYVIRSISFYATVIYLTCRSYRCYDYTHQRIRFLGVNWLRLKYYRNFVKLANCVRRSFDRGLIPAKCISVYYPPAIGHSLDRIVAVSYFCEAAGVNLRFQNSYFSFSYFESDTLINRANLSRLPYRIFPRIMDAIACFAAYGISSEYGYKIISQLSIKRSYKKAADEWFDKHIKGNWVAVHYRGTDVEAGKERIYKSRYRMKLDNYIVYLQGVLENHGSIFVCSDQQQFIDKMHEAFPGSVFARDIQRSYDDRALHQAKEYIGIQQQQDALIDMLILAKADLIYTTGSGFVDAVRYLNTEIKIISMDGRRIGQGKNNIPIPRADLYDKLRREIG